MCQFKSLKHSMRPPPTSHVDRRLGVSNVTTANAGSVAGAGLRMAGYIGFYGSSSCSSSGTRGMSSHILLSFLLPLPGCVTVSEFYDLSRKATLPETHRQTVRKGGRRRAHRFRGSHSHSTRSVRPAVSAANLQVPNGIEHRTRSRAT